MRGKGRGRGRKREGEREGLEIKRYVGLHAYTSGGRERKGGHKLSTKKGHMYNTTQYTYM